MRHFRIDILVGWLAIIIGLLVLGLSSWDHSRVFAQEANRAAVIVRFDDDLVEARCVAFEEVQISGYDLLTRSGLTTDTSFVGMGATVCQIEETGCGADTCFCHCRAGGDDCVYWSYWHLGEEGWSYASIGASTYQVEPGDVDGWSWGPGSPNSAIAPPVMSFEAVCDAGPAGAALGEGNGFAAVEVTAEDKDPDWFPYIVLAGIVVVLGALTFAIQRRRS